MPDRPRSAASVPLRERIAALDAGMHRLVLDDGATAIAKVRPHAPAGFFAAEAIGLDALRATSTLRVPTVHAIERGAIVIEDLGSGTPRNEDWIAAGDALARMHSTRVACFGFDSDGWCGDTPQSNARHADGFEFFANERLRPQCSRARDRGLLDAADVRAVDTLATRLDALLPTMPAVLVHGDLWSGNLHASASGELALIDGGAVHHGWAEADLAMLTLFGAPPESFFEAYRERAGGDARWRERAPLYNLYHLLNHLNLFGAGYLGAVRGVLRRYS